MMKMKLDRKLYIAISILLEIVLSVSIVLTGAENASAAVDLLGRTHLTGQRR